MTKDKAIMDARTASGTNRIAFVVYLAPANVHGDSAEDSYMYAPIDAWQILKTYKNTPVAVCLPQLKQGIIPI